MKVFLKELVERSLNALQQQHAWPALPYTVQIERTRDEKHGDYATNIALMLSKQVRLKPQELAQLLIDNFPASPKIQKIEIAGPGFINFYVVPENEAALLHQILIQKENFGHSDFGKNKRVHIEYVSANPTGPLHVGHGRGAAYGATCADLLQAIGYQVHREYYVNDAGRQMDILAVSVWLRYLEILGEPIIFPSNAYRGDYIRDIAQSLYEQEKDRYRRNASAVFVDLPEDEKSDGTGGDKEAYIDAMIARAKVLLKDDYETVHQYSADQILQDIEEDLAEFGVIYQAWFSEKSLMKKGAVQAGVEALEKGGYLYRKEGALWFRSTDFGDEKDRVLIRENGVTTYFASDVAYHWNKLHRGFDIIIDVLGADHHGYIPRVKAAMQALGLNPEAMYVPLVQFATLYRDGEKVQMSTRSGQFVTLRELRHEVGNDAARFFYIMRKSEQHMDFDLDLAKSQSADNPVYYLQYAHARICSVFRQLQEKQLTIDQALGLKSVNRLSTSYEKALIKQLAIYSEMLLVAAKKLEPHSLANYLRELANLFHSYYNAETFIVDDIALRNARLCLIEAVRQVMSNGLKLLGVSSPEKM
ncbi:MAG: arginine--tRNA ligase [Gammaproteobacteria bacterium GWF2_41_13]|nr:MAG: arginine--tRNA ligase [Gammaproteobacteria bacterium GWF2_41_13]